MLTNSIDLHNVLAGFGWALFLPVVWKEDMASFGGINKKRAYGSLIPATQKRIKICIYDKPPQVGVLVGARQA